MSHRPALALSIALTLILTIGIVVARDRLFPLQANAGPIVTTPAPGVSGADLPNGANATAPAAAPRVIEIPLPATQPEEPQWRNGDDSDDERSERARDRDDDRQRGDGDDNHEEGTDDDHDEDDDD